MCQLCFLSTIAKSERWPKPLEPLIKDLNQQINTAHDEFSTLRHSSNTPSPSSTPTATNNKTPPNTPYTRTCNALLTTLRTILTLLDLLDEERATWWQDKANQRKQWRESYQEDKITKLQVVNNKTVGMIEGMRAKLGGFCRWTLEMEDGVEGLEEGGGVEMKEEGKDEETMEE